MIEISSRIRAVCLETTIGSATSDTSEMMMNATGRTVGHLESGPTRNRLRRSRRFEIVATVRNSAICLPQGPLSPEVLHTSPQRVMTANDRRQFQRLKLAKPLMA